MTELLCFTDGGFNPRYNIGSYAAVFYQDGEIVREISGTRPAESAAYMELTAIIEALTHTTPGSSVLVHTDCSSVKDKAVDSWQFKQEMRIKHVGAAGGALSGGMGEKPSEGATRNKRSVWTVNTEATPFAHFATFPQKLIEPMILAGCPVGGVVYDPFMGSGTTALVARRLGRDFIGSELNPDYVEIARQRLALPFTPHLFPETPAPLPSQVSLFGE